MTARTAVKRFPVRSPYAAAQGCHHATVVETTCDYQPPVDWAKPLGGFVIRPRSYECRDCGAACWPESDNAQRKAIARPFCAFPSCDCMERA